MQQEEIIDAVIKDNEYRYDIGASRLDVHLSRKTHFTDVSFSHRYKGINSHMVRVFGDGHTWLYVCDSKGTRPGSPNQMIDGSKVYKSDTLMDLLYLYIK